MLWLVYFAPEDIWTYDTFDPFPPVFDKYA